MTEQEQHRLERQHIRAKSIGRKRHGDYSAYEQAKATLRELNMSTLEYEHHVRKLAKELGL